MYTDSNDVYMCLLYFEIQSRALIMVVHRTFDNLSIQVQESKIPFHWHFLEDLQFSLGRPLIWNFSSVSFEREFESLKSPKHFWLQK